MQYEIFKAAQSIPLIGCRMDGWGRKKTISMDPIKMSRRQ